MRNTSPTGQRPVRQPRGRNHRRGSVSEHGHGYVREADKPAATATVSSRRRRATGTPLLLFTAIGALTFVGIARVDSRIRVLALADEIGQLTREHEQLSERKRRLETERAYLRHPDRVHSHAIAELGMQPAPPERIQEIRLAAKKTNKSGERQ